MRLFIRHQNQSKFNLLYLITSNFINMLSITFMSYLNNQEPIKLGYTNPKIYIY